MRRSLEAGDRANAVMLTQTEMHSGTVPCGCQESELRAAVRRTVHWGQYR